MSKFDLHMVKNTLSSMLASLMLASCSQSAGYAVECIRFSNDAPVDVAALARETAAESGLEFKDFNHSLTVRQKNSGWLSMGALDSQVSIEFLRTEHGKTDICGRSEVDDNAQRARVLQITQRIKKRLEQLGVKFELPPVRPPAEKAKR